MDIQSKEVIDKISEDLKVQPALQIPRELAKQIQLSYNVNPEREGLIFRGGSVITGTILVHTTHATKRTFLTGASLQYMHNATANSTLVTLDIIPLGKAGLPIIQLRKLTLTAVNDSMFISLNPPIELSKDSNINLIQTFTVGAGTMTAMVEIFETDPQ